MGRSGMNMKRSEKEGLKKGAWSEEEDEILMNYMKKNGQGNWQILPKKAGLKRCGKSCRLRWTNYLRPDIKRGNFSPHEQHTIIHLHSNLGNKWSMIANHLPGRTDNEIKNYWNSHLRKKLLRSGIDPTTHQPIILPSLPINPIENLANIRLLRNLLMLINSNPLPPFYGGISETLVNEFDGVLLNIPLQLPSTLPNTENINYLRTHHHQQLISDTLFLDHGKNSCDAMSNPSSEFWLPGLAPVTPQVSSDYHNDQPTQIVNHDHQMFMTSNDSGAWEASVDDGACTGAFSNDIYGDSFLASTSTFIDT